MIMRRPEKFPGSLTLIASLLLSLNIGADGYYPVNASTPVRVQKAATIQAAQQTDVHRLEPGVSIEGALAGGGENHYQIALTAGQHVSFKIAKQGLTINLILKSPTGEVLSEGSFDSHEQGVDSISLVAQNTGQYTLTIQPLFVKSPLGHYWVKADELREATEHDRRRFTAQQKIAEADQLFDQGTREKRREALKKISEALDIWRAVGDQGWEAQTLQRLGLTHFWLSEYAPAFEHLNRALELNRTVGNKTGESETLRAIGMVYAFKGESLKGLEYLKRALALQQQLAERWQSAVTYIELAKAYWRLGDPEEMSSYFTLALERLREVGDIRNEAGTLVSLSFIQVSEGDYQSALNYLPSAVKLFHELKGDYEEASALSTLGVVYYNLGDPQKALGYFKEASLLFKKIKFQPSEANTLANLGLTYSLLGDKQTALAHFNKALEILRNVANPRDESTILRHIGSVYRDIGDLPQALESLNKSLKLTRELKDPSGEAATLTIIGEIYGAMGNHQKAFEELSLALRLKRQVKHRYGEAAALYALAGVERDRGKLNEARAAMEEGIRIIESLRAKVGGAELRVSYLAVHQGYYERYIDVLMRLHEQFPEAGHDERALEASERGRARVLLESLVEARADIRQGVDRKLVERERSLRQQLNAKEEQRSRLLSGKYTPEQEAAADSAINTLLAEYEQVQSQVRATSPRYAALTQPQPLNRKEIQAQLDDKTLLLVYSLGPERSFLFAVTPTLVKSYVLPQREEIEKEAEQVYQLLQTSTRLMPNRTRAMAQLSRRLLGPVADQLAGKRLVIVADGSLQKVPFAALPVPGSTRSMIEDHEIVYLPSVSVLGQQRRELAGRAPAPKSIAVIADPVYEALDERLRSRTAKTVRVESASPGPADPLASVEKSARESGLGGFHRLLYSRDEAEQITELFPSATYSKIVDFNASRATLARTDLSQYRILHFATHGLLNPQYPELSGIVLSLYDEEGRAQDGFLRSHELYNLKLGAELVVLSSCQTALGKEVRGEGLIGLSRGFMYAGAPRVVVSLWKVDDKATAELMKRFYQGMIREKLRPAAALRAAQAAMAQQSRRFAPYHWAGFTLQGEWR
jgi:CHAT domain-containing protein/Tfp pilus assembly protein PilF